MMQMKNLERKKDLFNQSPDLVMSLEENYNIYDKLQELEMDRNIQTNPFQMLHVLVDEYQDLNLVNYQAIRLLCLYNKGRLTIVGDDDQHIYGFRGGNSSLVDTLQIKENVVLKINYRATQSLIDFTQSIIDLCKVRRKEDIRLISGSYPFHLEVDGDFTEHNRSFGICYHSNLVHALKHAEKLVKQLCNMKTIHQEKVVDQVQILARNNHQVESIQKLCKKSKCSNNSQQ